MAVTRSLKKTWKVFPLLMVLVFISILPGVIAQEEDYIFQDRMNTANSAFFLVALNETDQITLHLEAGKEGKFGLFLFDKRPTKTHVNLDRTIDEDIYDAAVEHATGTSPNITYQADKERIYYVQIILMENGPDYYTLTCNKELTRYYLPQIPGYSMEWMVLSMLGALGTVYYVIRKKKLIASNVAH